MAERLHRSWGSRRSFLLGAVVLLSTIPLVPALAFEDETDEIPGHDEAHEHEFALESVTNGSVLPLAVILEDVQKKVPGDLFEARLKRRHGVLVYVLSILSKEGDYRVVTVNAKDKSIIEIWEK